MATSRSLSKEQWRTFFDAMSEMLIGKRAEVEVASLDLGDQAVAESLPLIGITYDSRNDLLDVAMVGLDHLIRRPRELTVQEGPAGIESVAVVSEDGVKQVIKLKEPLKLPAASAGA